MRIVKKAVGIGNGAAVYVPREYSGKEVVVILKEGLGEIRQRVLGRLIEFMDNIIGVYVFGSYARGEENVESDVDILIIVNEKDERIKNVLQDIDARVLTLDSLEKSIKNTPVLIMPLLKEAKVLVNPLLLEELKERKIDFRKFKWHFDDIKRIIRIIEKFIELDDKDISSSFIYSLIMRIRGCYVMECLLKDEIFSNEGVKKKLLEEGISEERIKKFFRIYREVRDDETSIKINNEEISGLIKILKKYLREIENETKKKIGKGN